MIYIKDIYTVKGNCILQVGFPSLEGDDVYLEIDQEDVLNQLKRLIEYKLIIGEKDLEGLKSLYEALKEEGISIEGSFDEHECDVCGEGYSSGYILSIGGKEYKDLEAFSSCFGGGSFEMLDVILYLFDIFGIKYKYDNGYSRYHLNKRLGSLGDTPETL